MKTNARIASHDSACTCVNGEEVATDSPISMRVFSAGSGVDPLRIALVVLPISAYRYVGRVTRPSVLAKKTSSTVGRVLDPPTSFWSRLQLDISYSYRKALPV